MAAGSASVSTARSLGVCPVVVGRDDELRVLDEALAAVQRGDGGVVVLTGEAGIGKSRLVHELAERARQQAVPVAEGRAVPSGATEPYRPITEAFLELFRDRPFPDGDELAPWLPALRAVVPNLGPHVGSSGRDESAAVRGEAILSLLKASSPSGQQVMILEDLHWADADTLAVFEYLADHAAGGSVMWVATCRSDEPCPVMDVVRRLRSRSHALHLPLEPLDDERVAEMVRACDPGADPQTVDRVLHVADGVPLLVEEVLASPGVPATVTDTVRSRMTRLSHDERLVLSAASVIGTLFDWQLLPTTTGLGIDTVSKALELGVASSILAVDGDRFRFRHALTREAVANDLLPPRRAALAAAALAAVETKRSEIGDEWGDVAADLAVQAGNTDRAGALLVESARASRRRGALATAIDALHRALDFIDSAEERTEVYMALLEALALAGRVDEAMDHGRGLIEDLGEGGASASRRAEVHLQLARAAVDATRWTDATVQIDAAKGLVAADPSPPLAAAVAVLGAEVALASGETDRARTLADSALGTGEIGDDVRCHAFELLGRCERTRDLDTARRVFEQAIDTAESAKLPIWRLRALQELGTIELFERGTADRLRQARAISKEVGALSTTAVLDVQLTAAASLHFELDDMAAHAQSAVRTTERLGLGQLKGAAIRFLAEYHAMRRDVGEMERWLARAAAATPDDPELEAFAWACRGWIALLTDDQPASIDLLGRAVAIARKSPQSAPGMFRGLWPVLLAASDDAGAEAAISEVRDGPAGAPCWNRGFVRYAEAVLVARAGDTGRAAELVRSADVDLAACAVWVDLVRMHVASPALADSWGQPIDWLHAARETFASHGLDALVQRCDSLLGGGPDRLVQFGITAREADVLDLVIEGLANKEIAATLDVSPRTVEKHVESLLRKTDSRSRTHLIAQVSRQ